jgi:hypothetical protein
MIKMIKVQVRLFADLVTLAFQEARNVCHLVGERKLPKTLFQNVDQYGLEAARPFSLIANRRSWQCRSANLERAIDCQGA